MISRRQFTTGMCACALGGLTACSTHRTGSAGDVTPLAPGQTPDMDTDEAGLWLATERAEAQVKASRARVKDKAINDLISDMLKRMVPAYAPNIRPYVMRIPHFNASMAPNGMTQVWSGLLLRCRNESQLATVVGHEFGHFLKRHSLQRQRDTRDKSNVAAVLGVGLALLGAPPGSGDIINLMVTGSIYGFSRDNEREADAVGLDVMSQAGYDPFEAPEIWRRLIAENQAAEIELGGDLFFATHPPPDERVMTLQRLAEGRGRPSVTPPDRLREALASIRVDLLMDQVTLGQFKRSDALFEMLARDGGNTGEPTYCRAELYRRRSEPGDEQKAKDLYLSSLRLPGALPEAHRGIGLIEWRKGEKESAREHFRKYLTAKPEAPDRDVIRYYLGDA